ncbi:uncharacterized protein LOC128312384 [Acinonyx jubatus]|uniref:Uncharacterized protein LOC128312384 n=1 Tax=Acinonyx jubatus TaxID=32536 RepID=A0ABM3NRA9_ACIJB|nr:uncharacterized protein LOC128312384 [Acinonyx jubatus]
MSLWHPGSLVTGPMDVAWWSRPEPGSRGALGLSLGEVGSNAAGRISTALLGADGARGHRRGGACQRQGRSPTSTGTCTPTRPLPRHLRSLPSDAGVERGQLEVRVGVRGDTWIVHSELLSTLRHRPQTPSLPSDRCHPRLHGSGPTLGGSLAREPDPQDTFGQALAACTCRELRSGALGTRYRPPNRRPQARVTLVSVSPVELRTSRAGANWVLWPPGSAFPWRTWLTSTHLYCSPTGLDSRGLETQRRMELWYRLAGRLHAPPARPCVPKGGGGGRRQAAGLGL